MGRTAAVDEAEERVQVHPAFARHGVGEIRREARRAQPPATPGHEVLVGDLGGAVRHHVRFGVARRAILTCRTAARCDNVRAPMRPLSSPVHEHRVLGRAEIAIGLVFIIIASVLNPIDAIVGLFVVAPFLTAALYLAVFRRVVKQAVAHPRPAPAADVEDSGEYGRRLRWPLTAQVVVFLAFTATTRAPGLLGGIALGAGIALVLTARWLERWENAHEVGLLRESGPRRRSADGGVTGGYYVAGRT